MQIGFIGLGQMGLPMASNLLRAGHELTLYNRSPAKAAPLLAMGARLAETPRDLAEQQCVVSMLADDDALGSVMFGEAGLIAHLARDAIHIGCSTISVELSERLADAHAAADQAYVAAPVFGRPEAAKAAALFIVAAGKAEDLSRAEPVLAALGQRIFRFGDTPSAANLVKLSGNFLIASVIEALGEAMALVGKSGVDPHDYLELLTSTLFNAPVYKTYGGLIADKRFEPAGFTATLGLKDIRLALAAGEATQVPMPLASLLRDRFLSLLAQGGGNLDWSAIAKISAQQSGQD